MRPFIVFTNYPLKDKPPAEYHLPHKSYCRPDGILYYLLRYLAFEKLNYLIEHCFSPICSELFVTS